jgi:CubicO group peptidase (beta-lactamase class C family)
MSDVRKQVQEAIDTLVESGTETGVQVAVYRHGALVVDAVAGVADPATARPMTPDTPIHSTSTGKGVTATVVHVLVERGVFGYDTRIAELWPEFGAHGKENATIRHALTHSVGVPGLPEYTVPEDLCDWDRMCAVIADTEPWWEPGTKTGYHAQTFGFIIGETVRLATGKPISQVLREEVAGPLGVADELFFGVPDSELGRLARLVETEAPAPMSLLTVLPRAVMPSAAFGNRADILTADIPSGGTMSARAVARMYAALLSDVDGVRLVSPDRLREISALAFAGVDQVMGFPTTWALGYGIGCPGTQNSQTVFGMVGAGGTAAYADTATGVAFAVTKNRFSVGDLTLVERVADIITKSVADS